MTIFVTKFPSQPYLPVSSIWTSVHVSIPVSVLDRTLQHADLFEKFWSSAFFPFFLGFIAYIGMLWFFLEISCCSIDDLVLKQTIHFSKGFHFLKRLFRLHKVDLIIMQLLMHIGIFIIISITRRRKEDSVWRITPLRNPLYPEHTNLNSQNYHGHNKLPAKKFTIFNENQRWKRAERILYKWAPPKKQLYPKHTVTLSWSSEPSYRL